MKRYDNVVFIGRFQPLHNGHLAVIRQALQQANKRVIVLIGSVNGPRTYKNPFTFEQRKQVIADAIYDLVDDYDSSIHIMSVKDHPYNNSVWVGSVQSQVAELMVEGESVALIGYHKDDSSNYLDWFPQWDYIPVELDTDSAVVDATTVRNILFEGLNVGFYRGVMPLETFEFLNDFKKTEEYQRIKEEYEIVKAYKKSWEAAPYAPTFVCTDAVVLCAGHILLVQRGAAPGKGQWALPGGFLNQDERIREGAIRELVEETKIDIPKKVLDGSIDKVEVFDHPNRSLRGRTITHAFRFKVALDSKGRLPKVKGSDDAVAAKWIPLNMVKEDEMFEDHAAIIQTMIGG